MNASPLRRDTSRALSRRALLVVSLLALAALACASGKRKPMNLDSINNGEVFEDLFGGSSIKPGSRPVEERGEVSFFTVPSGWTLSDADNERGVYKLKHDTVQSASIVISYDALTAEGEGRVPELERLHEAIVSSMPPSLAKVSSEMTRYKDEPRFFTLLRGKPKPDSKEMLVSGYTVSVVQDAYTIFSAYPAAVSTLAADVDALVRSLRPYRRLELPAEQEEEKPAAQPNAEENEGSEESEASPEELQRDDPQPSSSPPS